MLKKSFSSAYGGELLKKRLGRTRGRPLTVKYSMHLVIRSSKAKGEFSFLKFKKQIGTILKKFSEKHSVELLDFANVGNHLHLHIKLSRCRNYKPFIRAITSAIAMKVTRTSRWSKSKIEGKFFDLRPFTRFVATLSYVSNLKNYFSINRLEGYGYSRDEAKYIAQMIREGQWVSLS